MNMIQAGLRLAAASLLTLCLIIGPAGDTQARPRKMQKRRSYSPKYDESTKGKARRPDRHNKKLGEHKSTKKAAQ